MIESAAVPGRTGLWCLVAIGRHYGLDLSEERLVHDHALDGSELDPVRLVRLARGGGLTARATRMDWDGITALDDALPAVLRLRDGSFVVLGGVRRNGDSVEVVVRNPLAPLSGFDFWTREALEGVWGGEVVLVRRRLRLTDPPLRFGLRWFVPEILRQSTAFRDVVVAALVLQLLAFAVPIFFQIVIDKVVLHHSEATLTALGVGVLIAIGFDSLLLYLKTLLLLHATSKIDIRMATAVFAHLLSLPQEYFERISSGVLINHVQQGRVVREFLTGRLFFTLLDSVALVVFVPVLAVYSGLLTAVVLGFAAAMAMVLAVAAGALRSRLQALYRAEAERQALLVETVHGIGTVKALSLEPARRRLWDGGSAEVVERSVAVGGLSASARSVSGFLEKSMGVVVLWLGVRFVFDGTLTVGELVAFTMLSNRVTGPLIQLVTLVSDYQQAALSVRMLGQVMNAAPESGLTGGLLPRLSGALSFDGVRFSYPGAALPALDRLTFSIPAGAVVGVVGRSGSGKSTLVRLLQGIDLPQGGILRIDGYDLREIDRVHLRRQVGVVLQESFLFRGSIRENVAIGLPEAGLDAVVEACRLSGADEFVQRLPHGYDTVLEEAAANLSGGQKQRLAIARALLRRPPILILDEATSALDPESEAIVQAHLPALTRGRTTIIISHRLTSIRSADAILVLDAGRMVGLGRHEELLGNCPVYKHLWDMQTRAMR
ncbi:peptidase domain-containing ABC transporter [Azospirillum sp. RWY-5-1]|uniref:Peptidase domain-containing ABC transporter n=2 Tax=Azospirillum oleiclasticum TaxID=2735135 RepID=A0ABX2TEG4_9PROT|nr:peptidase domain-containing ABC transporter [Azospirillum oleiclasticum]NYZ15415.1 peptidase domain-containing ABC transporter [Azospirillum oleiclasticum]NYZ22437.1 peptidase domain-containing ABC transporter [Azospirillum oleiclasticum]